MSKKKKAGNLLVTILAFLVLFLEADHDIVRIVFYNLFPGSVELDESTEWNGGNTYEYIKYADISKAQYLHLYVPESKEAVPLLILVHGGGFYFNDNESRQAQFMYRYFRDHGYACASVNYRLGDEAGYPAALEDVKAAVRFLRANADRYGYDAEKFAIWGESAGGYLAVMAGVTDDDEFAGVPFVGEEEQPEPVSAQVPVIIDYYGAVKLGDKGAGFEELEIPKLILVISGLWLQDALEGTDYEDVESAWLRANIDDLPEEERQKVNPAYYIKKNLGQDSRKYVVIRHGDADLDVPYTHSEYLCQVLEDTIGGDKADLVIEHNYKHASDRFYSDAYLGQIRELLDMYFDNWQ